MISKNFSPQIAQITAHKIHLRFSATSEANFIAADCADLSFLFGGRSKIRKAGAAIPGFSAHQLHETIPPEFYLT